MDVLLHGYDVNQPTWFYLSLLLTISVFFRFTRVFTLRNLDLLLLLSASPGLLFVAAVSTTSHSFGHAWLFVIACLFLIRLFVDPLLTRRPYLGQNMNQYGLGFLCASTFAFLMTQAITRPLPDDAHDTIQRTEDLVNRTATHPEDEHDILPAAGPAAPVLAAPVSLVFENIAPRILAILAHCGVVSGLWFVGRNLFSDKGIGLAMSTLYLILPCTAYNVGEFNHVLPAALITWAFVAFRKPVVAGVLLGLACGTMVFPLFLLPIWAAFYGRQRAVRFVLALVGVAVVLLASLAFTSIDSASFYQKTIGTINVPLAVLTKTEFSPGFWREANYVSPYRLPVVVAYFIMVLCMTIWPRKRNFEILLAQSAIAVIGTQLWYTQKGGVYLLWYIPLVLMVIFRPRLNHLRFIEELEEPNHQSSKRDINPQMKSNATPSTTTLQLFR